MRLPLFLLSLVLASTSLAVSPDELLKPEKAFRISARALDARNVEVEFKIAKGYYLYRDRFSFATESGEPLAEAEMPRGIVKEDQFFGKSETFRDLVRMRVPVSAEDAEKGRVNLKVTSQGCSDQGVCYTPLEQMVRVSLSEAGAVAPKALSLSFVVPWLLLAGSLAGGLGLGWAAAGAPLARGRARRFVPAAIALWSLASAAAGALTGWLGSVLQLPWLGTPFAFAFLILAALWMHWSVRPDALNRPVRAARDPSLALAVLMVSLYAGNTWLGGAAAAGAALACALFPKAQTGARHEPALQLVALAMLAGAAWMAAPLLPDVFRMLAWAAWLIVAGTLLRAMDPLPEKAPWFMRLAKAAGVGLLVWGAAVVIGAASGARDPLQPFVAFQKNSAGQASVAPIRFERVSTLAKLQSRVAAAGRPVMLDFYADWCVSCKEMEQFTFSDPQVRVRMAQMLLLQVDVTRNTAEDKAILQRFRLFGPPGIVFFDARGQELRQRVIGYQPAERFSRVLDAVLAEHAS